VTTEEDFDMANIKSAMKRARQAAANRLRNRACCSSVASVRRQVLEAIEAGNKEGAQKLYTAYASSLDKAAKKGVIRSNNADRKKSRIAQRLQAMA
jgi:small subunit ribosomal protein S20